MKKLIFIGLLFAFSVAKPQMQGVLAEEPPISETSVESPETSEITVESDITVEELPEWVTVVFSPALIATALSVLGMLTAVVKLLSDLKKLKREKTLSNQKLLDAILGAIIPLIDERFKVHLTEYRKENVTNNEQFTKDIGLLMKVFALSQENTPESRIAILQLLSGSIDEKVINKAKEVIETQEQEKVDKKEELNKVVDEILGEDDLIDKL